MGERKVLNFYISPDFDHSIIPRSKRDRTKAIEVRMMLPFSLRCNTCGEYMYAGKKFNSKSEIVQGENYLGIRIFRFIIKCSVCAAEITFKTDPKNSDYECESGASRNFELWRDTDKTVEEEKRIREEEDKVDAMKSLENRTIDNKVEMDILDALDEIKAINQRHQRVDADSLIRALQESGAHSSSSSAAVHNSLEADNDDSEFPHFGGAHDSILRSQEDIDEEIIRSVKFKNKTNKRASDQVLSDSESSDGGAKIGGPSGMAELLLAEVTQKTQKKDTSSSSSSTFLVPSLIVRKKKKKVASHDDNEVPHELVKKQVSDAPNPIHASVTVPSHKVDSVGNPLTSLFSGYGSGTDSD